MGKRSVAKDGVSWKQPQARKALRLYFAMPWRHGSKL